MSIWKPKYFAKSLESLAKEVLPPSVYKKHGVQGLRMMDMRILMFLDEFRKDTGVPLTVNTPWNGSFTQSGLRDDEMYSSFESLFFSLSDHTRGAALDIKCKHGGVWLREKFIEREEHYYKKYGINFVECGPLKGNKSMSWAHFSVRFDFFGEVKYWSPVLGYISKEDVLENSY
ncbi:putative D-Ala-D-Ala carboxypeptidase family metallohydrolase [Vibrio phage 249E41-1]|nr:putative D-Ala-D-Ala carboxypeptidase family metallohydrolase [Vibrio phage 249E41-1]CAH9017365.1 putative D-Ala-D-Ala carboxypeptidase family metallohydrolase [Vibrio phage 193E37-1]